jgi:hypothetical protein
MDKPYSFQDHVHNYAVWTAARAVQRGFTNTATIKKAIEASGLRTFSETENCDSQEAFEVFHRNCANQLINAFDNTLREKATYGVAAKIIAIYLKTAVVIPSGGNGNSIRFIHPPIDRILLTNLSRKHKIKNLCEKGWTSLNAEEYWKLCERIKNEKLEFDWTLETYWHPEQERISEKY